MSQSTLCLLCANLYNECKSLFDENGQLNEVYEITCKYFDPNLLNPGLECNTTAALCLECWKHIFDFYTFQQTVLDARTQLEDKKPYIKLENLILSTNERELLDLDCNQTNEQTTFSYVVIQTNDDEISKKLNPQETILETINATIGSQDNLNYAPELTESHSSKDCEIGQSCINQERTILRPSPANTTTTNAILPINDNLICHSSKLTADIRYPANKRRSVENDKLIAKWRQNLECVICYETFANYSTLGIHFEINHPNEECHIICCDLKINQRWKLVAHIRKFHSTMDMKLHKCKLCEQSFLNDYNLQRHLNKNHKRLKKRIYKCKSCKSIFINENTLKSHFRKNHKETSKRDRKLRSSLITNLNNTTDDDDDLNSNNNKEGNSQCSKTSAEAEETELKFKNSQDLKTGNEFDPLLENSNMNENESTEISQEKENVQSKPSDIANLKVKTCFNSDITSDNTDPIKTNYFKAQDFDIFSKTYSNAKNKKKNYDNCIKTLKGDLECPKCFENGFKNFDLLTKHFQHKHPDERSHIICCQAKLNTRFRIMEHLRFHIDPKAYQCYLCYKCFSNTANLEQHKRKTHRGEKSCSQCQKPPRNIILNKNKSQDSFQITPTSNYNTLICCQHKQKLLETDAKMTKWKIDLECRICKMIFPYYSMLRDHFFYDHPEDKFYTLRPKRKNHSLNKSDDDSNLDDMKEKTSKKLKKLKKSLKVKNESKLECVNDLVKSAANCNNDKETNFDLTSQEKEYSYSFLQSQSDIQLTPLDIVDIKDEVPGCSDLSPAKDLLLNQYDTVDYNIFTKTFSSLQQKKLEYDSFIKKLKGNLKCPKCPKVERQNFAVLTKHFRDKHPDDTCYIICCNNKLNSRYRIMEHLRFHLDPNAYQCEICEKCFSTYDNLEAHRRKVHIKEQSCLRCKKPSKKYLTKKKDDEFHISPNTEYNTEVCCQRRKAILENDAILAKWKRELECRICETKFPYYSILRDHFFYDHPNDKFFIECCGRKIPYVHESVRHIRVHLDDMGFKCEICNSQYAYESTLNIHMMKVHKRNTKRSSSH